jgi:hypothetical protein
MQVCVEGMPVEATRTLIARQMGMATQLLVHILLLADEKSECFTKGYSNLFELSNMRESALKKARLVEMNLHNVALIQAQKEMQQRRRSEKERKREGHVVFDDSESVAGFPNRYNMNDDNLHIRKKLKPAGTDNELPLSSPERDMRGRLNNETVGTGTDPSLYSQGYSSSMPCLGANPAVGSSSSRDDAWSGGQRKGTLGTLVSKKNQAGERDCLLLPSIDSIQYNSGVPSTILQIPMAGALATDGCCPEGLYSTTANNCRYGTDDNQYTSRRLTRSGASKLHSRTTSLFDIPALEKLNHLFSLIDIARHHIKETNCGISAVPSAGMVATVVGGGTAPIATNNGSVSTLIVDAAAAPLLLQPPLLSNAIDLPLLQHHFLSLSGKDGPFRPDFDAQVHFLLSSKVHMEVIMGQTGMKLWNCLLPTITHPLAESVVKGIFPNSLVGRTHFSPAEDDLLLRGIITLGENSWEDIRNVFLPSKSAEGLRFRFSEMTAHQAPDNNFKWYFRCDLFRALNVLPLFFLLLSLFRTMLLNILFRQK